MSGSVEREKEPPQWTTANDVINNMAHHLTVFFFFICVWCANAVIVVRAREGRLWRAPSTTGSFGLMDGDDWMWRAETVG